MNNIVTLGSIATLKTGPFGTQFSASEYTASGIPVINVRNIGYGEIVTNELEYVSEQTRTRLSEHTLRVGDIVFGRKGSVDRHAYIDERYDGWVQGSDCIRVRCNSDINTRYLSHFLKLDYVKNQINNAAVGSTMASLNTDILSRVKIILPSKGTQDKIERVLSVFEEKIETNKTICAELESMAKTIYDYWFVQFDFPDQNGKPYRTSGGKMVWNEQLKREIPDGWKCQPVNKVFDVCYGFPFDTTQFTESGKGHPVVRIRDILENTTSAYTLENVDEKYWLKASDLLIGMDGNFHMNYWSNVPALLNQRCVRIRTKGILPVMIAMYSCKPYIEAREKNVSRTTVGHLSAGDIDALHVLIPQKDMLDKVSCVFDSFLSRIIHAQRESRELINLRDWLLPMLMNGQATVMDEPPAEQILSFPKKQTQQFTVKQAARSYSPNEERKDDTADLLRFYMERKK